MIQNVIYTLGVIITLGVELRRRIHDPLVLFLEKKNCETRSPKSRHSILTIVYNYTNNKVRFRSKQVLDRAKRCVCYKRV